MRQLERFQFRPRVESLEDRTAPASFQGLGFLPGATSSNATAVSADGTVVVGDSGGRAFRWTAVTGMVNLGVLAGYAASYATGVSADGSVVVGYCQNATPVTSHVFRWTAATGMVDISGPSYRWIEAAGVSGDGSTTAGRWFPGLDFDHLAFRLQTPGGFTDLGSMGAANSKAFAVSADGSVVVGGAYSSPYNQLSGRAFRWTAGSGMVDLGVLPGRTNALATSVSPDGSVVVGESSNAGNNNGAFLWTAQIGMQDLGIVPGYGSFFPYDVSDDGLTVVGKGNGSDNRAVRWTFTGGGRNWQTDLENIYGLGPQLDGWILRTADACSADGQIVVGDGSSPAGTTQAYISRIDSTFHVSSAQINNGASQRSQVKSLTVSFSTQVTFAGPVADAFTLTRIGGGAVNFTATANVVNGKTVVTINNFTGSESNFGSLRDGRYTLTAIAKQISANGQILDGNGDGTTGDNYVFGDAQGLFRFFGDINGDRRVDLADYGQFALSYLNPGNYNSAFDFNGDGRIDISDLGQFSLRYLTTLP